jgi:hypothetical protein
MTPALEHMFFPSFMFHPSHDQLILMSQLIPFLWFLLPLVILDLGLRGWSMWRAARINKPIWFVALLVINSLGILPAIFLLITMKNYPNMKQIS